MFRESLVPYWCVAAAVAFISAPFIHYVVLSLDPVAEIISLGIIRNHT
eukprot:CAMPEP_0172199372 /NCGR_PEP_ID=MMETSP1050-20130122/28650_1 /TAXON_ID=233186 /ORGANISM="Cryptomonas curvata, Strain CCAP979/52" /LENGTH=47 /DNA_ID= /DNA_START= /DNA_END= /DNA_ORIENTATION=